ncbi:endonuclease I family protein [Bacteriovorax sp. DB6_IX]|uniref:endonuclease I family protein n=1 Tax=Bacteriovorax sp. DB6_IX TaxID=1353530 RepID=UPI000389E30A|nr:endonuclease [Bacteriovorax sp. DB6_IX]EQC51358.1 nuclease, EndA/NucM family [Bacteriovorax sp. DB6_IX]
MKFLTLLFLLLPNAFAANSTYYPIETVTTFEESQLRDDELKRAIFELLNTEHQKNPGDHDSLGCGNGTGVCYRQKSNSYKTAKKILFGKLHLSKNNSGDYQVYDVYCRKTYDRYSDSIGKVGPDMVPNHQVVNCEHTWPQSKFSTRFNKGIQRGDLHHLYPTDSKANSMRGNHDFGIVKNGRAPTHNCDASSFANNTFEPPAEHKGNVARAMFYFSVRYQLQINSKMEKALKLWHEQDPVDDEERERNERIYEVQQNRNPFIDYPHLVDLIKNFKNTKASITEAFLL